MNLSEKLLLAFGLTLILFAGGYEVGQRMYAPQISNTPTPSFGNFTPVQGQTYTLSGSGVIASATTIPLTSFTTPDGRALTMNYFGSIGYAVMDPNSPTRIEDITFTGITQNPNGTAILTGVSRGIDFVTPYMASTTLSQAHAGGSYLILSNSAGFYGQQFFFLNNVGTSTAVLNFGSTTPPRYDAEPIWANFSTEVLASVAYVNSVVAAGAANASETVKGIVQLATAAQAALGTSFGSTGARLVLGANLSTSTPGLATVTGDVPTLTGSFLNQAFLNLTQAFTFSTTTQYFANIGTLTATSSSNLPANAKWNGVSYTLPSVQGAVSTYLQNNGSGVLAWSALGLNIGTTTASTSPTFTNTTSAELTLSSITVPANTLGTGNVLVWDVPVSSLICSGSTNGCTATVKIKYGGTTVFNQSFGWSTNSGTQSGTIHFRLIGGGLTSFQYADTTFITQLTQLNLSNSSASQTGFNSYQTGSATVDSTANQTLTMTITLFAGASNSSSMAVGVGTVTVSK